MRQLGPGDEIGGYAIEEIAGRGGMGLVYRARQRRPQRVVAIKVIAPELAADPSFRARFEQECARAAEIEHPNVIPVYEVGEDDGVLFISMRFVSGVDLGRLVADEGGLALHRSVGFVTQIADALDAAHARGLVHRDVKPANVLVGDGDHAYLTDFGLMKSVTDASGITRTGMFVGTVDYIAPEQVEGKHVDARADVYSLGCVTYQLISGQVPFPRESELAKLFAHMNDPPPKLTGVPQPLSAAVARAMAKDPSARFLSAGDFGRAVAAGVRGRLQEGGERTVAVGDAAPVDPDRTVLAPGSAPRAEPEQASPPAKPPRSRTVGSRWTWLSVAAAALVIAVIAAGVGGVFSGGGKKQQTTTITTRSSATSVTSTSSATSSAPTLPTTTAPTSPQRAILAPATVAPSVNECMQKLTFAADGNASPLTCPNGELNAVAWKYYAMGGDHDEIMSLGTFATPQQALQAMCHDKPGTFPLELAAYRLAATYYGWNFTVDPSDGYPSSC